MGHEFSELITSEDQLRDVMGQPASGNVLKVIPVIDEHCRRFIEMSPFLLLATTNDSGQVDISPKGDPPGFVIVLDKTTLAIPDRVGNRRADSMSNILQNPNVGLFFMIPGKRETLRVRGKAKIVKDTWLRERMSVNNKPPDLAIVVDVDGAFMHCAKCVIRSNLWDQESWLDASDLAPLARVLVDHANLDYDVDEYHKAIEDHYRTGLY